MNKPTPLSSIRKRCLDCREVRTDIKNCEFGLESNDPCALYPFRMGKGRPKMRDIREYCLWCVCSNYREVELCPIKNCPLWVYRLGKNPAYKDFKGNPIALEKARKRENTSKGSNIKRLCAISP